MGRLRITEDGKREWSTRRDCTAECQDCNWRCDASNADGVGAKHARKHKHTVRVQVEFALIYEHGRKYGS